MKFKFKGWIEAKTAPKIYLVLERTQTQTTKAKEAHVIRSYKSKLRRTVFYSNLNIFGFVST